MFTYPADSEPAALPSITNDYEAAGINPMATEGSVNTVIDSDNIYHGYFDRNSDSASIYSNRFLVHDITAHWDSYENASSTLNPGGRRNGYCTWSGAQSLRARLREGVRGTAADVALLLAHG